MGGPVVSGDDLACSLVDAEMTRCWCGMARVKDLLLLDISDDAQVAMLLVVVVQCAVK